MKLAKLIEFLRSRLKMLIWISFAVLALVVVLDAIPAIVDKEHAHTVPEHWPGFWAVYGFFACVLIILLSKWFGHLGIMTREDYYEDGLDGTPEAQLRAAGAHRSAGHSSAPGKSKSAAHGNGHKTMGGHHE